MKIAFEYLKKYLWLNIISIGMILGLSYGLFITFTVNPIELYTKFNIALERVILILFIIWIIRDIRNHFILYKEDKEEMEEVINEKESEKSE